MMLSIFSHAYCLFIFFGEMSLQKIFWEFLNQVDWFLLLSFRNSLYVLSVNPSLDMWFANIFSHSVSWLVLMFMASFDVPKFFILMKSSLFFFCCLCLWCHIQEIIAKCSCLETFPLCFLLRVLWLSLLSLDLWSILSQFMYHATSLLCMWIFSFPGIMCWKVCFSFLNGIGLLFENCLNLH